MFEIFYYLEKLEEFDKNVEAPLRKYFYHAYLKCKRNYKAILILLSHNDEDFKNSYVEAIPLLRILVESFFHLCYATSPINNNEKIHNYNLLENYQLKQMLNNRIGYRIITRGQADELAVKKLKKETSKVKNKDITLFKNIRNLAKKTNNLDVYDRIYRKLNSYVHYNPITYISYGVVDGQNSFNFGDMQEQLQREVQILFYTIEIAIKILLTAMNFLKVKPTDSWVFNLFKDWETLREKYQSRNLDPIL